MQTYWSSTVNLTWRTISIQSNIGVFFNLMTIEMVLNQTWKRSACFTSEHTYDDLQLDKFYQDSIRYNLFMHRIIIWKFDGLWWAFDLNAQHTDIIRLLCITSEQPGIFNHWMNQPVKGTWDAFRQVHASRDSWE